MFKKKKKIVNQNIEKDIYEFGDKIIFEEIQTGPQEEPILVPVEFCDINEEKRKNK